MIWKPETKVVLPSLVDSQLTLPGDTTLPGIASLELGPRVDGARFDAQISQPAIFGFKVAHALDLVHPAVPHRHIRQGVAAHHKTLLATLFDHDGHCRLVLARRRCINSVRLARESQVGRFFGKGLSGAHFVDVRRRFEAGDGGLVNVL